MYFVPKVQAALFASVVLAIVYVDVTERFHHFIQLTFKFAGKAGHIMSVLR